MKHFLILIIAIVLHFFSFGQNMETTWQQCFGGSEPDYAYDMAVVGNGYLIVGGSTSTDGNISGNIGMGDGWLVKVDTGGLMEWEKSIGGTDGDYIFRIIPTQNNNFYLLASSSSSDVDISNDPYPDSEDFWIVKIDIDGNIIWDKIVGGSYGDIIWNGSPTLDGGVVAVGWTYSNDGDVSVHYGGADTWAVKISSEGELEWDFTIGTDWIDKGQAILATSDGGYLIASNSSIHEDAIGNITCTPHSYGWAEGVLFKLDSNLNVEWQQCYGGSNHDGITALIEVSDGYVFGAYVNSNDGDILGWHGANDIWIVKLDFIGNIVWQNPLGGSRSEFISTLLLTDDESIIIPGYTQSNDGNVSGNHTMSEYDYDIWFVKLNNEGDLLSQQCFGGAGSELINFGVVKKSDNNFVIAGQTDYGPSYDVGCTPHGGNWDEDYWVFEIQDTLTSVLVSPELTGEVKVYPNPAGEYVCFEVADGGQVEMSEVKIFNSLGVPVHTPVLYKTVGEIIWDVRGVAKGVYFYQVTSDGYYSRQGKVVVN